MRYLIAAVVAALVMIGFTPASGAVEPPSRPSRSDVIENNQRALQRVKDRMTRVHPRWVPLTNEIADAVAEGVADPSRIPSAGQGCLMNVSADFERILIRCPGRPLIRG